MMHFDGANAPFPIAVLSRLDACLANRRMSFHVNWQVRKSVLAGPSCDRADARRVQLPLQSDDGVLIRNNGAYPATRSSVGPMGFPPLAVIAK